MKSINHNSGFWVLIALGGFVWWVRHDFGKEAAIFSVIALLGAALVIVGLLFGLGFNKSIMANLVEYERAQSATRRVSAQGENMLMRSALGFARPIANLMIAMKGNNSQAAQPTQQQPNYWEVDAEFERVDHSAQGGSGYGR